MLNLLKLRIFPLASTKYLKVYFGTSSNKQFPTKEALHTQNFDRKDKSIQQQAYYHNRIQVLNNKQLIYPHFKPTLQIKQFIEKYRSLLINSNNSNSYDQISQRVAGRVTAIRTHGKTTFIDIRQGHIKLQVACKTNMVTDIRRGDVIGIIGKPFVTKKGELSIQAKEHQILAPCLWMLPQYQSLKDNQTRYRSKHLDLITNHESMNTLIKRSKIIGSLRRQLNQSQYVQVQTPILSNSCGGALAKPFITYHNDHKMNMYLRIAPELDLKKLLVGGIGKVFEIGKNFRNQSIDQTHNPQFTSCQLYCAYADYRDMISFTHKLINKIAIQVNGVTTIKTDEQNSVIDLSSEWEQKDFMDSLEKCLNQKLPIDFQEQSTYKFYNNLCYQLKIPCDQPRTISRLLDKLAAQFLEGNFKNPYFIINHPKIMSPLAKPIPQKPHLTQRFELFINGYQLVNSYTELNDPRIQKINTPNEKQFIEALQYGLVPCAGWGIGIDRLIMLLTGKNKIQQVLAYPLMREK